MCDLIECLDGDEKDHFEQLTEILDKIKLYVNMAESRIKCDADRGDQIQQPLNSAADEHSDPQTLEGVELRDYQRKGFRWILSLYENGMNGILADEMGLGKTLQVIAALAALIEAGVHGPFLVVVPLSLLAVWSDQLNSFAPRLPFLVYYGTFLERLKLRRQIRRRVRICLSDPIRIQSHTVQHEPPSCSIQTKRIGRDAFSPGSSSILPANDEKIISAVCSPSISETVLPSSCVCPSKSFNSLIDDEHSCSGLELSEHISPLSEIVPSVPNDTRSGEGNGFSSAFPRSPTMLTSQPIHPQELTVFESARSDAFHLREMGFEPPSCEGERHTNDSTDDQPELTNPCTTPQLSESPILCGQQEECLIKKPADSSAVCLLHLDEVITEVLAKAEATCVHVVDDKGSLNGLVSPHFVHQDFLNNAATQDPVTGSSADGSSATGDTNLGYREEFGCDIGSTETACDMSECISKVTGHTSRRNTFVAYPIVLTTFDVAMRDSRFLRKIYFKGLIVDEGQRLKNAKCRLYKILATFSAGLRLLITGTPLQNRISELWALLHFILPEVFTSLEMFERWFDPVALVNDSGRDRVISAEAERSLITRLHCIISPFMLRRTKTEALLLLPPKREILLRVGMTPMQQSLYNQALELILESRCGSKLPRGRIGATQGRGSITFLDQANIIPDHDTVCRTSRVLTRQAHSKLTQRRPEHSSSGIDGDNPSNLPSPRIPESSSSVIEDSSNESPDFLISPQSSLNNGIMLLRRIVNHPFLAIDRSGKGDVAASVDTTTGEHSLEVESLVAASGKMQLLDRLLKHFIAGNHKVLLFSQLTIVLDIIEELLNARLWNFVRLDGSTTFAARQEAVIRFNFEPAESLPIFLVSTRAGGCGLNLQAAADTVIIFDSDWNPQTDLQAQDRCHRIGQRHPVLIVRLVTADTIDETILQRAHIKRGLERLVLSSVSHPEISTPPSRESSSPSLRWKRLRSYLHDPQNTALGLSSVEIERLLCGKDYDKEVTQVEHISDDALHSLLNRSDLYMEWERLKSGESSRNTILCEPDLDYESNDVEHCGPPTVPPSSKFDPSNLSPLPSSCRNSKRRMTDYSGLLQSPSLNLTNSAPLSGNHVECPTTYSKDLQPFLSLPDSQTDFGWSPEP